MLSGCKQAYTHVHSSPTIVGLTEAHSITIFQNMYIHDSVCGHCLWDVYYHDSRNTELQNRTSCSSLTLYAPENMPFFIAHYFEEKWKGGICSNIQFNSFCAYAPSLLLNAVAFWKNSSFSIISGDIGQHCISSCSPCSGQRTSL